MLGKAPRVAVVLGIGAAALALVLVATASSSSGSPAKKRCHSVTKKVRGKNKRVRVCRAASADVRLALAIQPAPPLSPGEHVTFSVGITNRGPDAATKTYLDVEFPPGYRNVSARQRGKACASSGSADDRGISLTCPKTALPKGRILTIAVRVDLGLAVPVIPNVSDIEFHAYHGVRDPNDFNNNLAWEPELANCDEAYPDVCIPPPPPTLTCADIAPFSSLRVIGSAADPDPHGFDPDHDGVGCEPGAARPRGSAQRPARTRLPLP